MSDPQNFYDTFWPRFAGQTDDWEWLPIQYWNYWDFARSFSVEKEGKILVLDTPFLEEKDEWAAYFDVYEIGELDAGEEPRSRWLSAARDQMKRWRIPVCEVTLDKTRKSLIHGSIFAKIASLRAV